jgi:hypothetical protein
VSSAPPPPPQRVFLNVCIVPSVVFHGTVDGRYFLQDFRQHFFHDAYFAESLKIAIIVRQNTFITRTDSSCKTKKHQLVSLILQCRKDDAAVR